MTSSPREAPRCAQCGAFLRPDVVWFEETLPDDALARAERAARDCDVLLVVGTVGRGLSRRRCCPRYARHARRVDRRDQSECDAALRRVDFVLRGPSGIVLPALVAAVWRRCAVP